jgi:hypothetical protein
MIYNTIHHDIRTKHGLSLLDYCLLESIYHLSTSSKQTYKTWCNASKSSFSYLASKRTIGTRFEHLESKGWLEFKDDKRYLKKTTKKYYQEVYSYALGVKKLHGEEIALVKELHPTGEEVAPQVVKKLHGGGEEVAPNNNIDNKKDNDIDRESKKALTQENKNLLDQIKNLTAANLELKNKSEAQKEEPKSSAKKVKAKHEFPSNEPQKAYKANSNNFPSMSEFEEMPIHEDQIKKKYQLELSKFTYPSSWTEYLINQFLEWCAGKDEKLLGKFGSTQVKALIRKINGYLKDYDAKTIGDSIELSLSTPYNNFNPKWIIDRQEKESAAEAAKQSDDGTPSYMLGLKK